MLIHTGQHYDANMSDVFFRDLRLPDPDYHLGVGSGSHAEQTGGVMIAYERICESNRPHAIVVVGDVNSTAACAMVGAKLRIPVVHLEAGLRSGDRRMPEEINRLVTDAIADVLWTPSEDADENLIREGVSPDKIDRIGNIMIDSLELLRDRVSRAQTTTELGLQVSAYGLVTLHRPSNVDSADSLRAIVDALVEAASKLPIVFVAHPRTMKGLERFGLSEQLGQADGIRLLAPLSYVEFMNILMNANCVITDSGGLQEESTYLDIPCLTLRENTERPITITMGTNKLSTPAALADDLDRILSGNWHSGQCPPLWDGKTAQRAVECLERRLA